MRRQSVVLSHDMIISMRFFTLFDTVPCNCLRFASWDMFVALTRHDRVWQNLQVILGKNPVIRERLYTVRLHCQAGRQFVLFMVVFGRPVREANQWPIADMLTTRPPRRGMLFYTKTNIRTHTHTDTRTHAHIHTDTRTHTHTDLLW